MSRALSVFENPVVAKPVAAERFAPATERSAPAAVTKSALARAAARAARPLELSLRRAATADLVPLQFFFDTLLRRDYFLRRGQLAEMLTGRYHQVWIAEIGTILVGLAVTTRGTRLVNVLVHPAYRGLGIGRALVAQTGADEVRVKLNMSTGDPRGFYAALGFEHTELSQTAARAAPARGLVLPQAKPARGSGHIVNMRKKRTGTV